MIDRNLDLGILFRAGIRKPEPDDVGAIVLTDGENLTYALRPSAAHEGKVVGVEGGVFTLVTAATGGAAAATSLDTPAAVETLIKTVPVAANTLTFPDVSIANVRAAVTKTTTLATLTATGLSGYSGTALTETSATSQHKVAGTVTGLAKGTARRTVRLTAGTRTWVVLALGAETCAFQLSGAGVVANNTAGATGTIALVSGSTYDLTLEVEWSGVGDAAIVTYLSTDGSTLSYAGNNGAGGAAVTLVSDSTVQPAAVTGWRARTVVYSDAGQALTATPVEIVPIGAVVGGLRFDFATPGEIRIYVTGVSVAATQWAVAVTAPSRAL